LKSVGEEYNGKDEDVNRKANNGIDKIEDFVNFVSNASLGGESVMVCNVKVGTGYAGPKS
jgi:predicted RNA-binding protein with TRAM domain